MMKTQYLFPAFTVSPPLSLTLAIRSVLAGSVMVAGGLSVARAELPVPVNLPIAAGGPSLGPLPVPISGIPIPHTATEIAKTGSALGTSLDAHHLLINQKTDKTVIDWQSFNIDRGYQVKFDQPDVTSVALNNIHQADPSRIFGTLTANGQVYLVNQNGFVFGKDSQVNVNSLIATTLNISEETFQKGIVQAFSQDKLPALEAKDSRSQPIKELYLKDANGQPVLDQNGNKVKIQINIEKGARLKTNAANGRIILAGPSITNKGSITATDGQVILAASQDKVYLQPAPSESGLRGLLVEVGTGGDVNNLGRIIAERGNDTLIGFFVTQQGQVSTTTSVKLNGSVRLLAREGIQKPETTNGALLPASTVRTQDQGDGLGLKSTVKLAKSQDDGHDSLTSVELDANKKETAVDAQTQARSQIEIMGHSVIAQDGAVVRAKSGSVKLTATDDPKNPKVKGDSRIYLEKGSRIDVSGVKKVVLPMDRNVLKVELRNNELRDSPLQKDGILHGVTVAVDVRDIDAAGRIPIADVSGAQARIARNIDERSTAGGSIELNSSGDVITQSGSVMDFSGGSVAYQKGYIETTKLVSQGQIYNIGQADPNRHYDGLLGQIVKIHAKWGLIERWSLPGLVTRRLETGYVDGKAGGSLSIAAFNAELDGIVQGKTINGPLQRTAVAQAPGSSLSIDLGKGGGIGKQDVVFGRHNALQIGVNDPFPSQDGSSTGVAPLTIDPHLLSSAGIRKVTIATNGGLRIEGGTRITLLANSEFDLAASGFDIQGAIIAPSGHVSLAPGNAPASSIMLGSDSKIDVSGRWVNDWLDSQKERLVSPLSIDGGSVKLTSAQGDLRLEQGSKIDVSGGGWLQPNGKVQAGKGGQIDLVAATTKSGGDAANLILDGTLNGWALHDGGKLSLRTNEVVIGPSDAAPVRQESPYEPLVLAPEFFQQGGFSSYDIGSNVYGLKVAEGVTLTPRQQNLQLPRNVLTLATGNELSEAAQKLTLPDYQRNPTQLKLSFAELLSQNHAESLTIGQGALIQTDPQGSVQLSSDTSILVDGSISAPAGNIEISLLPPTVDRGFFPSQSIWLGPNSHLTARGIFQAQPDPSGLKKGDVRAGGNVSVVASRGYIAAQNGSVIDVSGTSERLDFQQSAIGESGAPNASRVIASDGGAIKLAAGEGILADGIFSARSGGQSAAGGALTVALDGTLRNKPNDSQLFPDDINPKQTRSITISTSPDSVIPETLTAGKDIPAEYSGHVLLKEALINDAGFATVKLKTDVFSGAGDYAGSILFQGDVHLQAARSIILDAPLFAWSPVTATDTGQVALDTAYAALGSSNSRRDISTGGGNFSTTLAPDASIGNGQFSVNAKGIDLIGGLSFGGYGQVNLNSQGDVRTLGIIGDPSAKNFKGELKFAGDLNISADQVYPTTLSEYRITATGTGNQTFTLLRGTGQQSAPAFSAGGHLTVTASDIVQSGVLKAPMGSLTLNATQDLHLTPGSVTSVSGNDLTIPFGRGSTGQNWLYPLNANGSKNLVIDQPPEKRLVLNGQNVTLDQGAEVNLSGGGDLYAYEFVPGPGGSVDVLDANDPAFTTKFAVIPQVHGISTPYDPLEFPSSGLKMGDSLYLSGGAGLAAGWYTLLPAHYALLPGAYMVTPQPGTQDLAPGQAFNRLDGVRVVAGRYGVADTIIADSRWQGFAVEPGSVARTRSEFRDYSANKFFADKAAREDTAVPSLPNDAGNLTLAATSKLTLGATLDAAAAANARKGQVDIDGENLAVVGKPEDVAASQPGTLSLLADDLSQLNAPSLLLGGQRRRDQEGVHITVGAKTVKIAGDASLKGQELVLAAQDQLTVDSGAALESSGKTETSGEALFIANRGIGSGVANSDGALLRLSSAGQAEVTREQSVTGKGGVLLVGSGAQLKADGSMLLDSTKDTKFSGDIVMNGGSLALKSSKITIGNAPTGTSGLVLTNAQFTLDELRLISASDLDLYGSVGFNTQHLVIDAAAVNGFDNTSTTTAISAKQIELFNSNSISHGKGDGTGSLALTADEIDLGGGNYAIAGFEKVELNAQNGSMTGTADTRSIGKLSVAGDLTVKAGRIDGNPGATAAIDASGHHLNIVGGTAPQKDVIGLGASWSLTADTIDSSGRFELPSGILKLTALSGDLNLAAGTNIDVTGQSNAFGDIFRFSPAGDVTLTAAQGNIVLASEANIDLSGANAQQDKGGDAGLLRIQAPNGTFQWDGQIHAKAAADSSQGGLRLDVANFAAGGFSGLNTRMNASGFTEEVSLRQRSGDIIISSTDLVSAHRFELSADQGKISIDGKIDASGPQAGEVSIYGRNGVSLGAEGKILARATKAGEQGGTVTLDTVHRDDNGAGLLDLSANGAVIDVSAGNGGTGGSIHLRSGRDDSNGTIAVSGIQASLTGFDAQRSALEATRIYDGQSTITAADIVNWQTDTANFMNSVASQQVSSPINILPGIEVRGSGSLTLADRWDFMDGKWVSGSASTAGFWDSQWRYTDAAGQKSLPGFLTLRAGGDININASLTDAFATTPLPGGDPLFRFQDVLQPGVSWSYHLVAGGDVNLAPTYFAPDPLAPSSSLQATQVVVRTGTGNIGIDAGGDIRFNNDPSDGHSAAAIYTMGRPAAYTLQDLVQGKIPNLPVRQPQETLADYLSRMEPSQLNTVLRFGLLDVSQVGAFLAEYPMQGGSINLSAGDNIDGIQTGQLVSDWLVRSGSWSNTPNDESRQSTAWGVNINGNFRDDDIGSDAEGNVVFGKGTRFFNQNVGALGGGNVTVEAGGDIRDLSVVIPTTGKPLGTINDQGKWQSEGTTINGGGDLRLSAANSIVGGEFLVGRGSGTLSAGGSISDSASKLGPILELGDAMFSLYARKDLHLGTAFNPTVVTQRDIQHQPGVQPEDSLFFTYGSRSAIDLISAGGNLVLESDTRAFQSSRQLESNGSGFEFSVYPGALRVAAFSGDVRINDSLTLFPSADGQLQIFANQDIGADAIKSFNVSMSDADPTLLPSIETPAQRLEGDASSKIFLARETLDPSLSDASLIHAVPPLHQGVILPSSIVAENGDIAFNAKAPVTWFLPSASEFSAGRDIRNLNLSAQNLADSDITRIKAARDIVFDTPLDNDGVVQPMRSSKIDVGGPGQLQVVAGRNINLGSSVGIQTVGNFRNRALPASTGATIDLLAGVSDQDKIDYASFLKKYGALPEYQAQLKGLSDKSEQQQLNAVLGVLFNEVKQSARTAAAAPESKRANLYQRGFEAIKTLFPGSEYKGDLALVFSQIKTLAGGGINLAVPGGKVDVGLAGKNGGVDKTPDQLGIVVQQSGDLNAVVKGDFNVNQSRVFTIGGGDIAIWSSEGDIDAGKGAKSAISAPPPITSVDEKGNIVTEFPPILSGSGIQAIRPSDQSGKQGNVYLAAPAGVVDAGEAGISGGKVIIAATAVIGASNIQASGGTVGVPTAVAAPVVPAGADSAAAGVAKSATQNTGVDDSKDKSTDAEKNKAGTSILSADVVGYGQCSVAEVRDAKPGCGG